MIYTFSIMVEVRGHDRKEAYKNLIEALEDNDNVSEYMIAGGLE